MAHMKMRKFAVIFWTALTLNIHLACSQVVTLVANGTSAGAAYSEPVELGQGDYAEILYVDMNNEANQSSLLDTVYPSPLQFTIGSKTFRYKYYIAGPQVLHRGVIAGPATVKAVSNTNGVSAIATLRIVRANSVSSSVPQNSVVIPENASGEFQVLMESSTDLISWTAANPGTYGGATTKRFFRVRIVQTTP